MSAKQVAFSDVTLRDGAQSMWAMRMTYGMHGAVASELDQAGYDSIELPVNAVTFKLFVRFFQEDPWQISEQFRHKITRTKKSIVIMDCLDLLGEPESRSMIRMYYDMMVRYTGSGRFFSLANTRNELDRSFPWLVPMAREMGLEFMPAICYYPSPRTTDEYYADLTRRLMEYKPDALMLKDAGGLLSLDSHPDTAARYTKRSQGSTHRTAYSRDEHLSGSGSCRGHENGGRESTYLRASACLRRLPTSPSLTRCTMPGL